MSAARRVAAVCVVLFAVIVAGCGEKSEGGRGDAEPVTLALDFYVNPDHAGIYTALDRGYFDEAGLEVDPVVPSDPSAPIRQVAAGRADLAISYEPEVLLAQEEGLPVVAVAALVDRPLTSLISLPEAQIADVRDLQGKTVATAGIPYQADYLEAILDEVELTPGDVSQVDVGFNLLPALLSGRADAILGGFLNIEGVDLTERGQDPRIAPVDELGVPTYDELVLVANSDDIADDPEPTRLFIAALERGTEGGRPRPRVSRRSDPERRRRPRPEAHDRRDRAHPPTAAARQRLAAVRIHGRPRMGAVRRLLRRPGPDLDPPNRIRDAHERVAAGADPGLTGESRLRRELQRRARRHGAVPADQREGPCEAAERRVRREVLLDLLDRRPAAEAGESADQLDVGQVAGGQRVGVAATVEGEDLQRPRADVRDPQEAGVGGRIGGIHALGGDLAGAMDHRDRSFGGEIA